MSIIQNLPFEWQVGLRYTRAGKRSGRNSFISFISLISMAGIGLGVAALIIVLSVMHGFQKEVSGRMLSVLAHVEVFDNNGSMPNWREQAANARKNPEVIGAAPFAEMQGMLVRDDILRPAIVRGVLPDVEPTVSDVAAQTRRGSFNQLQPGAWNIVLGIELARSLHVQLGEKVTLALAQGQATPAGVLPRVRSFTVVGIFEAGHNEFDSSLAFVHLSDAEKLLRLDAPAGLRLRLADMHRAPFVAEDLKRTMPGDLTVRDWSKLNATWFGAVQIEKRMMFIILMLIIAVAAFNLVSTDRKSVV